MATFTVQVSDDLLEALSPLDGELAIDWLTLRPIIRDALRLAADELLRLSEDADDVPADRLRFWVRRLDLLATAAEAVA